jgi:hypothetical protein
MRSSARHALIMPILGLLASLLVATCVKAVVAQGNGQTKLNCDRGPCDAVARGRAAFSDRNLTGLEGNGRACADCHMPSENFQLSPAAAKARFEAFIADRKHNKNADDPLFRAVDADDFRTNGDDASDYSNLVENGLVRVTLPLPPNVRLLDPATCPVPSSTCQPTNEATVDVFRAVIPVSTSRLPVPMASTPYGPRTPALRSVRIQSARTRKVAISTMRASARCRSKHGERSSRTPRF